MIHQQTFRKPYSSFILIRLGLTLALLAAMTHIAAPAQVAHAATIRTIEVDNVDDDKPDDGCTLREAIDLANKDVGAGKHSNGCSVVEKVEINPTPTVYVINLPSYTYTLSGATGDDVNASGDLDIEAYVSIVGNETTISGGGIDRVFHINPTGTDDVRVSISGVTIRDGDPGDSDGGGIYNDNGRVQITDSMLTNNEARLGGGILSVDGTLVIHSSTVFSNTSSYIGGGIVVYVSDGAWTAELYDSTVSDNYAEYSSGGICTYAYSSGATITMTIENSIIHNNHTGVDGGGFGAYGDGSDSVIIVTLENTTISDNGSGDHGGGFFLTAPGSGATITMTLESSTVSNNDAGSDGGGFYAYNSTLMLNNSTISDNTCDGNGGGIYVSNSTVDISHVTITDNLADDDKTGDDGGGLSVQSDSTVNVKSTIIAGNYDKSGGDTKDCHILGTFNSHGYNLVGNGADCPSTGTGDQAATYPRLGPLANNGGDTQTHALLSGSPAIDAVADCTDLAGDPVAADQRGVSRPVDGDGDGSVLCDVGAYEAVPLSISKAVTPTTDIAYQGIVTYTVVLSNSASVDATGVLLTDTLPSQVDFASWVAQPPGADESDDEITWNGPVSANNVVTFTFVVTHTGDYGDMVTNTAEYSHASGDGSDDATFTVESIRNFIIYLPLVTRNL